MSGRPPDQDYPLSRLPVLLVLLVALLTASCSGSEATVRGQVLYQGRPVEGAVVTFHPKSGDPLAHRPSGLTDADGRFTLMTGTSPGAPPGEYVVTVNRFRPVETSGGKKGLSLEMSGGETRDEFQGKPFASRETTKLTATIRPGSNELEPFRLD